MATKGFKRTYPSSGRILFDGGLSNKFKRSIIPDNESPDCQNVEFQDGAVGTRQGWTVINTASVGSFPCDGLYTRHATDGSETMCAWYGGTMFTLDTTSLVTVGSAQSIWTAGVRVGAAEYEDHIFFGNGNNPPMKYDGSEFTRHGIPAPSGTVSAVSDASSAGTLTGSYSWKFNYVNSLSVEGDVGAVITAPALASGQALLSDIPVAPQSFGVNARNVYRTDAGGATYKYVTQIADNSTTTYVDNKDDSELGAQAPLDSGVPPEYNAVIYHQNRLFFNDPGTPNFVWFSDLAEPYTVASTNFVRVGDNTSDLVKGFAIYNNSLIIFCDKSQWIIYMPDTDESNWILLTARSPYGSKSPYAPVLYNNKVLFPAMQNDKFVGFAALAGDTVDPNATLLTVNAAGSDLKSDRIEPDMFLVQEAQVGNISGIVYQNRAYITVTHETGTTNNRVWVFDFSISNLSKNQEAAWVPWTGINAAQFTICDSTLYFANSDENNGSYIAQLNDGTYNDNGAAIDSYFWTKEFSGLKGEENNHKDFRECNLFYENAGKYFMNFGYRVNSDKGSGQLTQINLDPGTLTWGTLTWGTDNWGGGFDESEASQYLATARGTRIQFKFSNQNVADQRFRVLGLNFDYNRKSRR